MTGLVDRLRNTPTGRTWDSVGRSYDYPQHLPIEAADEIERLRGALEWMRDRDDRNGSLPEAYREKIDAALSGAADTEAVEGEPVEERPKPWGIVRKGSDGEVAVFSTKFNSVKARFTAGNALKSGQMLYVRPHSPADTDAAQSEIDRLRRELEEARRALEKVSNLIDDYYFEGDKEYQVVIIARAALRAGEEGK